MPFFIKSQLEAAGQREVKRAGLSSPEATIVQFSKSIKTDKCYDIFLSHKFSDADLVLGLKAEIEKLGYSVFIDWIEQPQLDRAKVTSATASWLRQAMKQCTCLLYAFSPNSSGSRWMPWELGYSDALHGKVAVVPVLDYPSQNFPGQEYLNLYPYIEISKYAKKDEYDLWVHETPKKYNVLSYWLNSGQLHEHN